MDGRLIRLRLMGNALNAGIQPLMGRPHQDVVIHPLLAIHADMHRVMAVAKNDNKIHDHRGTRE
jgi:hypothetical protein